MLWTDDPVKDAERYWAQRDRERPVCGDCGQELGAYGYRIGGTLVCPACLEKFYREEL